MYTNQAAYSVLQNLAENVPFFLNKTVNNTTGTPTLTTNNILTSNPNGAIGANGVNHDFKIEYNEVWNLTVQKSVSTNTTVSVQYVGSRTVHADSSTAVNLPMPGPGTVQGRRPFPNLNSFATIRWDGWAFFNGLTVESHSSHRVTDYRLTPATRGLTRSTMLPMPARQMRNSICRRIFTRTIWRSRRRIQASITGIVSSATCYTTCPSHKGTNGWVRAAGREAGARAEY